MQFGAMDADPMLLMLSSDSGIVPSSIHTSPDSPRSSVKARENNGEQDQKDGCGTAGLQVVRKLKSHGRRGKTGLQLPPEAHKEKGKVGCSCLALDKARRRAFICRVMSIWDKYSTCRGKEGRENNNELLLPMTAARHHMQTKRDLQTLKFCCIVMRCSMLSTIATGVRYGAAILENEV